MVPSLKAGSNFWTTRETKLNLGAWLRIDSAKERFAKNAAADALLQREYRSPSVLATEAQN